MGRDNLRLRFLKKRSPLQSSLPSATAHLVTVVEVVPLVAGTAPVIVGSGVVGAVVGVLGLLVESAGLGVLDERLGVQVGGLLSVKNSAHLHHEN